MTIQIYYSKELMKFKGKFPDTPERLAAIVDYLETSGLDYKMGKPKPASRKDLERVHSPKYLDEIKRYKRINTYFPDEPVDKNTYKVAALAAGAACSAAEHAFRNRKFSFAVTRPKGGHAGRDFFGGYSYINNMAVAIAKLMSSGKVRNPLIISLDAHFCNGTNNIFLKDERVSIVSIHQHADSVYPYIGKENESTPRVRCYENRLWITDKEYVEKIHSILPKAIEEAKPDIIGVSMGFNTYYKDMFFGTVTKIKEPRTYLKIGKLLDVCAKESGAPIFGVLEGGYWAEDLGELVYNFLKGFEMKSGGKLPEVSAEGYR